MWIMMHYQNINYNYTSNKLNQYQKHANSSRRVNARESEELGSG